MCIIILSMFSFLCLLQEEDYHLDARHLTIRSPPSGKYDLEIVTKIYPQKNTSLEVNEFFTCFRVCFFLVYIAFSFPLLNPDFEGEDVLTLYLLSCRDFTSHLEISVLNVRLKASVKLHFIRFAS